MRNELRPNEEMILEIRKNWLVLAKPLMLLLLFLFFTVIAYSLETTIGHFFLLITLINVLYLAYKIVDRNVDIWVVTNLRVIDEYGVFSHSAKESPLDKINNISYQQSLVGRIFDYGSVQIQTAAEMGATTYNFVTSPKLLKDTVTRCQYEYKQAQIADQAEKLAQAIKGKPDSEDNTKECPFCAETIKAKAKICRFCGKTIG